MARMALTTFRSRARVVDLLGRQQIADLPTALGELFKNSLDAGAENVYVDWGKEEDRLSIRDDGVGMRETDLLSKWLVVATESKATAREEDRNEWLKYATERQKKNCSFAAHGEKGIGRLSVAKLGRYVVLWSVWGSGEAKTGVFCVVHWHLFQHPTKLFDELPIPYATFKHEPTKNEIIEIFDGFLNSSETQAIEKDEAFTLAKELKYDLEYIRNNFLQKIKLEFNNTGTTFHIGGLSEEVPYLFNREGNSNDIHHEKFQEQIKLYTAFSVFWNPFRRNHERNFTIHPSISSKPIDPDIMKYWEPEDFHNCDHHIEITVEDDGYAHGTLTNYLKEGPEIIEYQMKLPKLPTGATTPGKFKVEIGYLEGNAPLNSGIPNSKRNEINERLKYAGGFCVYMDDVRVQPYGDAGTDFVEFEKRRLKNAGRYYFSMARMFGGVFLTTSENKGLKEKAGREGFIVNGAYKGLRHWICDIFIDLAYTYYGTNSPNKKKKTTFSTKGARQRLIEKSENYIQEVKEAKANLRNVKAKIPVLLDNIRRIIAAEKNSEPGELLGECEKKLQELAKQIEEIESLPGPPIFTNNYEGDVQFGIENYLTERDSTLRELEREYNNYSSIIVHAYTRAKLQEEKISELEDIKTRSENQLLTKLHDLVIDLKEKSKVISTSLENYEKQTVQEIIECRTRIVGNITAKEAINDHTGEKLKLWETSIRHQCRYFHEKILPRIIQMRDDISHLHDNTSSAFMISELSHEIQELKENNSFLTELAQIGLVIETATHEYTNNVIDVKNCISQLLKEKSERVIQLASSLDKSFSIIDEKIRLYNPLIGKRGKEAADISGQIILSFIEGRLPIQKSDIAITSTDAFNNHIWHHVKWPIFLGAIYNIVLNAIYWVSYSISNKKQIRFSVENDHLIISDNGPGINENDLLRIFSPGFSRRRGGKGLGLYIAKTSLKSIGYQLYCSDSQTISGLEGANFIISKL